MNTETTLNTNSLKSVSIQINPVYKALKENATYEDCGRCLGKGHIWAYAGIKNGICFKCGGNKTVPKNKAAKVRRNLAKQMGSLDAFCRTAYQIEDLSYFEAFKSIKKSIDSLPNKYKKLIGDEE